MDYLSAIPRDLGCLVTGLAAAGLAYINRGNMGTASYEEGLPNRSVISEDSLSRRIVDKFPGYAYISPVLDHLAYGFGGTLAAGALTSLVIDIVGSGLEAAGINIPLHDVKVVVGQYAAMAIPVLVMSFKDIRRDIRRGFSLNDVMQYMADVAGTAGALYLVQGIYSPLG